MIHLSIINPIINNDGWNDATITILHYLYSHWYSVIDRSFLPFTCLMSHN